MSPNEECGLTQRYQELTPLQLPGAECIRLRRRQAALYQWLASTLRAE
jgi:hypothetical protein